MINFLIFVFNLFFILPVSKIFFPYLPLDISLIVMFLIVIDDVRPLSFIYLFIFGVFYDYFSEVPLTFFLIVTFMLYYYFKNKINFTIFITQLLRNILIFSPLIFLKGFYFFFFTFVLFSFVHSIPWKRILVLKF